VTWQPGQSGNAGGARPKPFKQMLTAAINEAAGDTTKLRKVVDALIGKAFDGDTTAIKEIAERLDGKVPQAVTGADDGPLQLELVKRVIVDPNAGNTHS
jgi:hypothetical protein